MLRNYLTVAIRTLLRNKAFSLINILGLAIGISASLIIFLIVQYDYSFDRFEPDGDRIYRVVSDYNLAGNEGHTRGTAAPLAKAAERELTGPDLIVSFHYYNAGKLVVPDGAAAGTSASNTKPAIFKNPEHLIFTDKRYFELLPYQWLAGSQQSALNDPGRVVLTESRAKLYFPNLPYASILGQAIIYDDSVGARVSGVVRDLDSQYHSDFNFKEFISMATVLDNAGLQTKFHLDSWGGTSSDQQLYFRLGKNVKVAAVDAQLKKLFDKHMPRGEKYNNFTWTWRLQPLSDLHFNAQYGNFDVDIASKTALRGLMLVALFLLVLACINFINLTTAQATQRAREIGIRKTLGSSRRRLIAQFLSETFVITCIATILSFLVSPLLINSFADYLPRGISFFPVQASIFVFLFALILVVSLLAGFYPAVVLSAPNAMIALKNQAHVGTGKTRGAWIRQSLTVSQFVIAQFFIIGALVVGKQIHFMINQDLGFDKEAILSFQVPDRDTSSLNRNYMLGQVKQLPGVRMASLGSNVPFSWNWWTNSLQYKDGKKDVDIVVEAKAGDTNYLRLFKIPLLAGRDLLPSDSAKEVVINEACLHALGFTQPQAAIGKIVNWDDERLAIVGVMRDFHAHALNFEIKPMVFRRFTRFSSHMIIVALRRPSEPGEFGGNSYAGWQAAIAGMKTAFAKTWPQDDFSYDFFDESIANAYQSQQRILHLLNWATGLTIFISCLGLLGLVIYTTNRRTKEIAVRKVLGASVSTIVSILSREFLFLVVIAFAIAIPLSWWAGAAWMRDFPYRTPMSWWVFAIAGTGMVLLAFVTLSIQTIRAARANPINNLRTE